MRNQSKSHEFDFHINSNYKLLHFYISQLPNLLLLEIFSAIMYIYYSEKFIISFYCLPIVLTYLFMIYKFAWGGDWRCLSRKFLLSMIGVFICAPIFFSIYFFVWEPTLSLVWYKSDNCKPLGQRVTQLGNLERYGLQYVQITSDLIGLSCVTSRQSNGNQLKSYDFYEKGEFYTCDTNYDSTNRTHIINQSYYNISSRFLEQSFEQLSYRINENNFQIDSDSYQNLGQENKKHTFEIQKQEQIYSNLNYLPQLGQQDSLEQDKINQNIRHLNGQHANDNQQKQDSFQKNQGIKKCRIQYSFSQVKIPSWICQSSQENKILIEKLSQKEDYGQSCYYAYYGSKELARINARSITKDQMKEKHFLIVKFQEDSYYFKEGFIALIIFAMIPTMLFSLQSLFSFIVYEGLLFILQDSIEAENEEFKRKTGAQDIHSQKQAEGDQGSSQTDRQQQRLEPNQIVQILSPNSQLKDRDFYDIYNNTRRKQITQVINPTVNVNTEDPINITKFNGDTTKSVMIKKSPQQKNQAQSIDELDDHKRDILNGPRNITEKFMQDTTSSSEEEANDNNCSYIKIRNIYKKKLNPKYQKEIQQKKKEGVSVENEEIKVIQEIKEQQKQVQEKLQEKKNKKKKKKLSPTLDETINCQNDLHNILDVSSLAPQNQNNVNKDEDKNNPTKKNDQATFEELKDSENEQMEVQEKQQNNPNEENHNQQKEQEDAKQIQQIEEAYQFYDQQADNPERLETPPQDVELIQ
ncbi:transmembrane protein, putative (macronuclear) [Tetrahymena thermophila SB210]|uniref:Transmembrane protein, putative n=1 Tax=Tetrahymena thermophila (strain SB210) TaxID=312017 RepID=Q237H4_TETTS|nr:transmembrane protein, putative [Tetrahymena thermophila SB210]EAR92767.2 transmembrane protein, putative [Tetrahymena thermophila SB210]|eukprot:XP_001013012.2 transmembrane protein, putative [Tetrahymena thermophila SB210]